MTQPIYKIGMAVLARPIKWSIGKTKEKETKYVRVQLEHGISWTGWLTPKTEERTMKALATMGFKGASLQDLQYPDALDINTEIAAKIDSTREYNGKTYYDASFINPIGGFDARSKDLLDEFDIDTRAYIKDAKKTEKKESALDQDYNPGVDSSFTADDIPF